MAVDLLRDKAFKYHLAAYLLVNAVLIVINIIHHTHIWFVWPLIGWGIGIVAHASAVKRKLELMGRLRGEDRWSD